MAFRTFRLIQSRYKFICSDVECTRDTNGDGFGKIVEWVFFHYKNIIKPASVSIEINFLTRRF